MDLKIKIKPESVVSNVVINHIPTTNFNFTFTNLATQTISYDVYKNTFFENGNETSPEDFLRYLKTAFSNYERYFERCWRRRLEETTDEVFHNLFVKLKTFIDTVHQVKGFTHTPIYNILFDRELFDNAKPFTYKEAFQISSPAFRALVFGSIDISEMINNLGSKRIATDGKEMKRKTWDSNGNFLGEVEYTNVYEVWEVDGSKLEIDNNVYAVKCWCTSTNKEHWIWIDEQYKLKPLHAIASTFRFHENVIPFISALKRQGDIMLVEMSENVSPDPNSPIIPLTPEQYFSLLVSES